MAKTKKKKSQWLWIIIPVVVLVLFSFYNLSKNNLPQSQQSSIEYQEYQDSTFGFSIEYPQTWEIRNDTQVFENGDAIAFGISGPSQKERTELTDGSQVIVSKPFSINKDLIIWIKDHYDSTSDFSQITFGSNSYQVVYVCGLGCMRYFYTLINDKAYGVAIFAEGLDNDKVVYENASIHMLKSLKFDSTQNKMTPKEEAVSKVKALPEVIAYLIRVPNGLILVNGEDDTAYMVQVYELNDEHSATFNWYKVDKSTGDVEKQF